MAIIFVSPYRQDPVLRYYVVSFMWLAIIWSARLSMLFSVIRIAKGAMRSTLSLHIAAGFFLLVYIFLTAQLAWECETKTAWKQERKARCSISKAAPACQLVADIICDTILLIAPIRLFRMIRERCLRYRLILVFGTSIITTIASFPHSIFGFRTTFYPSLLTALIEVSESDALLDRDSQSLFRQNAVSLMVCNIPVLVTAVIKLKKSGAPPSSPDNVSGFCVAAPTTQPTAEQTLTTQVSSERLAKSRRNTV
ncbi:hypothetical protein AN958_10401 [Leucoagaricus sp. SymC.cos]|nr:hypothetical protein AN958_10401 [Leucoagaricus sp. SymC.cos]